VKPVIIDGIGHERIEIKNDSSVMGGPILKSDYIAAASSKRRKGAARVRVEK